MSCSLQGYDPPNLLKPSQTFGPKAGGQNGLVFLNTGLKMGVNNGKKI